MSWTERSTLLRRLEIMINSPDTTISTLLSDKGALLAITQRIPKIILFLMSQITQIIDVALINDLNHKELDPSFCLRLFTQPNSVLIEEISKDRAAMNHLVSLIDENVKMPSLMRLFQLTTEVSDGKSLFLIENSNFLELLLTRVQDPSVFSFLYYLSLRQSSFVIDYVKNFDLTLFNFLKTNQEHTKSCLKLLSTLMFHGIKRTAMLERMTNKATVIEIIDIALHGDKEISKNAYNILKFTIHSCVYLDHSEFDEAIKEKSSEIKTKIISQPVYTVENHLAMSLLRVVGSNADPELFIFLYNQMLKEKTNSFLHIDTVSSFKALGNDAISLIEKHHIRESILKEFDQRESIFASYWGALYLISIQISAMQEELSSLAEWDVFVETKLKEYRSCLNGGCDKKMEQKDNFGFIDASSDDVDISDEDVSTSSSSSSSSSDSSDSDEDV